MVEVFVFNPEHDLALAHGGKHYHAPRFAIQMRRKDTALMAHAMPTGAALLCEDEREPLRAQLQQMGYETRIVTPDELSSLGACRYHPWGWDAAIKQRLLDYGARNEDLPDDEWLSRVRQASHRRTSIAIHQRLRQLLGDTQMPPLPVECSSIEDTLDFCKKHPFSYVKTPWSNSGHGIYHVRSCEEPHFLRWLQSALHKQGSVICEVAQERLLDGGLEFFMRDGVAKFAGYSVFQVDSHSQFTGCLNEPQQVLREHIMRFAPNLDEVIDALQQTITELVPFYHGPLGIDIFAYRRNEGNIALNPCVELNLRCTMGFLQLEVEVRS